MKNKKYTNEQICQAIQKWLGILQDQLAADNQANGVANEAISLKDLKSSKPVRTISRFFNRMSFRGDKECLSPERLRKYGPNQYDRISAVVIDWEYDCDMTKSEIEEELDDRAKHWKFAYKILTMYSRYSGLPCVLLVGAATDLKRYVDDNYPDDSYAMHKLNTNLKKSIEPFDPEKDYSKGVV